MKIKVGKKYRLNTDTPEYGAFYGAIGRAGAVVKVIEVYNGIDYDVDAVLVNPEKHKWGYASASQIVAVRDLAPYKTLSELRATLAPQTAQVRDHIVKAGNISGVEAAAMYKVRSLPKRISELRAAGYVITSQFKRDETGQRYVRYAYNGVRSEA